MRKDTIGLIITIGIVIIGLTAIKCITEKEIGKQDTKYKYSERNLK